MRVQPEAVEFHPAGEVHLPYALKRDGLEELVHRLAAVQRVGEHVVHVEQKPAVGSLHDFGDKGAIREFIGSGPQVVDASFHRDRDPDRLPQRTDRRRHRPDPFARLSRRKEEAGGELRRLVVAQVVAHPGGAERLGHVAQERELLGVGRHSAPHRGADAMDQLAAGQAREMLEYVVPDEKVRGAVAPPRPERLGLELEHVEKPRRFGQKLLDGGRVGDPDAQAIHVSGTDRSLGP